jgi:hypothetical protein
MLVCFPQKKPADNRRFNNILRISAGFFCANLREIHPGRLLSFVNPLPCQVKNAHCKYTCRFRSQARGAEPDAFEPLCKGYFDFLR